MSERIAGIRDVIAADAEAIATLLEERAGAKSARREARRALAHAFAQLGDFAASDSEKNPPEPTIAELLTTNALLERLRRELGDRYHQSTRRIRDVWIRTPLPDRVMHLVFVARRDSLVQALCARVEVRLALSDARVQWLEKRCRLEQPGLMRPIRPATDAGAERLLASELELIRKRGRSRFS